MTYKVIWKHEICRKMVAYSYTATGGLFCARCKSFPPRSLETSSSLELLEEESASSLIGRKPLRTNRSLKPGISNYSGQLAKRANGRHLGTTLGTIAAQKYP